jgi:hypothetical protein
MFAKQGSKFGGRPLIGYLKLYTSEPGPRSRGKPLEERDLVEEIVEIGGETRHGIFSSWQGLRIHAPFQSFSIAGSSLNCSMPIVKDIEVLLIPVTVAESGTVCGRTSSRSQLPSAGKFPAG